jgi:hypothetical protein
MISIVNPPEDAKNLSADELEMNNDDSQDHGEANSEEQPKLLRGD